MNQVEIRTVSPVGSPTSPNALASPWTKDCTYIIEATRKAHACCKSCSATIEAGRLRVGVVYQHRNGFICINWHHVECYSAVKEIPLSRLEGFSDLDSMQQKRHIYCYLLRQQTGNRPSSQAQHFRAVSNRTNEAIIRAKQSMPAGVKDLP
ncbi:hypothetical protein JM18_007225 [Phytophthora kernoviae]|uniref:PARP-type domain-containing protein n=2 Tax=Phytophthora kernoviae TaxID=325452 RepID=A0A8T0LSE7_9STRA|nr:hypothetical protein G195_010079 [Phytophthora kernoviae 00238/432]KAG2519092.1 hypothetical protein JM16_007286 [Phytophthora kernoviae]KAG2520211.1 hypothetical protein JM18_007225 [Phytophthora kernoviae]